MKPCALIRQAKFSVLQYIAASIAASAIQPQITWLVMQSVRFVLTIKALNGNIWNILKEVLVKWKVYLKGL